MIRKIILIDESKCNGCGKCASACHEGAIGIINGKAKLLRDDYCDGLGDCLPSCPTGAITFTHREAVPYNEIAVLENKKLMSAPMCPGSSIRSFNSKTTPSASENTSSSQLAQWPCQIKLSPISAPYFDSAHLLIAADCTAYAYKNIHSDYMSGKITLIGCPKLDNIDYSEKLTKIISNNSIQSITLLRMEVPCCGGMEMALKKAVAQSGKSISIESVIVTIEGKIQ